VHPRLKKKEKVETEIARISRGGGCLIKSVPNRVRQGNSRENKQSVRWGQGVLVGEEC